MDLTDRCVNRNEFISVLATHYTFLIAVPSQIKCIYFGLMTGMV